MQEVIEVGNNLYEISDAKQETFRTISSFLIVFIVTLAAITCLRTFVFFSVQVAGASMNDTFYGGVRALNGEYEGGDTLVVNRLASLDRGDVVVFDAYQFVSGRTEENGVWIKRIIGMPGETIWAKSNVVYILKKGSDEPVALNEPYVKSGVKTRDFAPVEIPEDCYFVMGDNRENSTDSRYIGAVKREYIEGVVPKVVIENKDGWFMKFLMQFV